MARCKRHFEGRCAGRCSGGWRAKSKCEGDMGGQRRVWWWLRGKKGKCARGYGGSKASVQAIWGTQRPGISGGGAKVECASGMGASKAGVPVALETTSPLHTPTPKGMCAHCYGESEGGFASDMGGGKTIVLVVCRRCAKRFTTTYLSLGTCTSRQQPSGRGEALKLPI